jgi:hypothetical protein
MARAHVSVAGGRQLPARVAVRRGTARNPTGACQRPALQRWAVLGEKQVLNKLQVMCSNGVEANNVCKHHFALYCVWVTGRVTGKLLANDWLSQANRCQLFARHRQTVGK